MQTYNINRTVYWLMLPVNIHNLQYPNSKLISCHHVFH